MRDMQGMGIDTESLARAPTNRIFRGWFEDWEHEGMRDNDAVMEACLLEKYKGLDFLYPGDGKKLIL